VRVDAVRLIARKPEDRFLGRAIRINKYLNRPLAALIVRAVFPTRVTPNQLTWGSFLVGLAGACFFASGGHAGFAAGGVLAQVSSIIDCADGMLARARNSCTEYGATLDLLLDRLNEFLLLVGLAAGLYRTSGSVVFAGLGLLATALYFLETSIFYIVQDGAGQAKKGETGEMRALLLFLMSVFGVANRMEIGVSVLALFALGANIYLVFRFLRPAES
jgi:phosphatidylglycerophosphate synthase